MEQFSNSNCKMYTPHTVSLINFHNGIPFLVFLRGVMLQALNGQSVQRRGDQEETIATLYVPLSVNSINPSGENVTFLPPRPPVASLPPPQW